MDSENRNISKPNNNLSHDLQPRIINKNIRNEYVNNMPKKNNDINLIIDPLNNFKNSIILPNDNRITVVKEIYNLIII